MRIYLYGNSFFKIGNLGKVSGHLKFFQGQTFKNDEKLAIFCIYHGLFVTIFTISNLVYEFCVQKEEFKSNSLGKVSNFEKTVWEQFPFPEEIFTPATGLEMAGRQSIE